jgi:hypothetical protein
MASLTICLAVDSATEKQGARPLARPAGYFSLAGAH